MMQTIESEQEGDWKSRINSPKNLAEYNKILFVNNINHSNLN